MRIQHEEVFLYVFKATEEGGRTFFLDPGGFPAAYHNFYLFKGTPAAAITEARARRTDYENKFSRSISRMEYLKHPVVEGDALQALCQKFRKVVFKTIIDNMGISIDKY